MTTTHRSPHRLMQATRLLFLSVTLTAIDRAQAEDWPHFRGPRNDGISQESLNTKAWQDKTGFPVAWTAQVGVGFSNVAVAKGSVYTMGYADDQDALYCLDEKSGQVKWTHRWKSKLGAKMYEGGPGSTPTVYEGRVYAASKYGQLWALDAATGKVVWHQDVQAELKTANDDWGLAGSPVIHGKTVVFNVRDGGIALDLATGVRKWSSKEGSPGFDTPVVAKMGAVDALFLHQPKALVVSNASSGAELWRHPFGKGYYCSASDPIVHEQRVFISTGDMGGEMLDFSSGQPRSAWKTDEMGCHMSSAVRIGTTLYGQSCICQGGPSLPRPGLDHGPDPLGAQRALGQCLIPRHR
jgi:outer membrane protein assembly factor BamB